MKKLYSMMAALLLMTGMLTLSFDAQAYHHNKGKKNGYCPERYRALHLSADQETAIKKIYADNSKWEAKHNKSIEKQIARLNSKVQRGSDSSLIRAEHKKLVDLKIAKKEKHLENVLAITALLSKDQLKNYEPYKVRGKHKKGKRSHYKKDKKCSCTCKCPKCSGKSECGGKNKKQCHLDKKSCDSKKDCKKDCKKKCCEKKKKSCDYKK